MQEEAPGGPEGKHGEVGVACKAGRTQPGMRVLLQGGGGGGAHEGQMAHDFYARDLEGGSVNRCLKTPVTIANAGHRKVFSPLVTPVPFHQCSRMPV
jgi:hypothetical protein